MSPTGFVPTYLAVDGTQFLFLRAFAWDTEPFVSEIHYDNAGTDLNEAIEITGKAGVDLSAYSIVFYNGANGQSYRTESLSGTLADEASGFGALAFS